MRRDIFESEHDDFRSSVRGFLAREAVPLRDVWEEAGTLDRVFWKKAAGQGFVGFEAPEQYGGLGIDDYRFNALLLEETSRVGLLPDHFMLQNDVLGPYLFHLANEEQQARWLPGFTAGDLVAAIAMSEPGAGSDLRGIATTAKRDGDHYVLSGSKTFISSGNTADLIVVAARTSDEARASAAFSLIVVEGDMPGFERGRSLKKVGRHSQDTAELFFNDVVVPVENRLGDEGTGLRNLMRNLARERLAVSVAAVAGARFALDITIEYARDRKAFGTPIGRFQVNQHALAQMTTETDIAQSHLDRCIVAEANHQLSHIEAAGLKAWTTEMQWRIVDRCLQLHGGYGYMDEYMISRQWRDARVQRIYGGSNEIMWEIVGRSLEL